MLNLFLSAALLSAPPVAPPPPLAAPFVAAPPLPPVDPASLALARTSANAMFGDGTMARIFDRMLSPSPGGYASTILDMTLGDMMAMAGPAAAAAKMPGKDGDAMAHMTLRQMMAKGDPYFDQRLAAIHDTVVAEATRLGPKVEAPMREGLALSLAHRFSPAQLTDMARFFSSPTGLAYGRESYTLWMDPAAIRSMMSAMPALAAELPEAMKRVKAASDRFPSPVKPTPPPVAPTPKKTTPHH